MRSVRPPDQSSVRLITRRAGAVREHIGSFQRAARYDPAMATALHRTDLLRQSLAPFLRFFNGPYSELNEQPGVANFAVGNPHEMAMPAYVDAVRSQLEPQNPDWFAYKVSEPNARAVVAKSLSATTGLAWDPEDVQMTNGGFAAIAVALRTVLDRGDEAIFLSPPWFFYELLILSAGATPVRVRLAPPEFTVDEAALEAAITPRTRLVILNTPHNPSGRVYRPEELEALAAVLRSASARNGRPIYLLSDEPYRRIVFDGHQFHSPAEFYPETLVCYSYGKQLLAPGMRIGYLTWPPTMTGREQLREDAFVEQCATGFAFPNADLQHAMAELEPLSIDMAPMERRRDRVVGALREMGYETTMPEGTFYVMVRSPLDDDLAFTDLLNRQRVLTLPGKVVELPGWLRLSLTASDEMVEAGLPGFARALAEARQSGASR
jgi:aspartate aminotransferase